MLVDTDHMFTISEANNRGVARLASDAESGYDLVLTRNGKPVAAVVSTERLDRLQKLEDAENDLHLLAIALSRVILDDGARTSFDDVLASLGLERDDLVKPAE